MALAERLATLGNSVSMVFWDTRKLSPYVPSSSRVNLTPRSNENLTSLVERVRTFNPEILLISGWMDLDYLRTSFALRRQIPVRVALFDDQWTGGVRQRLGSQLARAGALRPYFTHAAACGSRQYEFARRFGFNRDRILLNWLSADTEAFPTPSPSSSMFQQRARSKRALYVGRFSEEKGVKLLATAWARFQQANPGWTLDVVGAGPLLEMMSGLPATRIHGFLEPARIARIATRAAFAIVPSLRDQWGVVVHEMTSLGLPVVASDAVGSSDDLVIPGFNGLRFSSGSVDGLVSALEKISSLSEQDLRDRAKNSLFLSKRFSTDYSAKAILGLVQ